MSKSFTCNNYNLHKISDKSSTNKLHISISPKALHDEDKQCATPIGIYNIDGLGPFSKTFKKGNAVCVCDTPQEAIRYQRNSKHRVIFRIGKETKI